MFWDQHSDRETGPPLAVARPSQTEFDAFGPTSPPGRSDAVAAGRGASSLIMKPCTSRTTPTRSKTRDLPEGRYFYARFECVSKASNSVQRGRSSRGSGREGVHCRNLRRDTDIRFTLSLA